MARRVVNVGEVCGRDAELQAICIVGNGYPQDKDFVIEIYLDGRLFYFIDPIEFCGGKEKYIHEHFYYYLLNGDNYYIYLLRSKVFELVNYVESLKTK